MLPEGEPEVPEVPDDGLLETWDLGVAAEVLAGCLPAGDWAAAARELDQPDLVVTDAASLRTLLSLFSRASGSPFPVGAVLLAAPWANASHHLSLLEVAVAADSDTVNFSRPAAAGALPLLQRFPEAAGLPQPEPNDAWFNPNLVRVLLALGEDSALAGRAKALLDRAARGCPEVLLVVLANHAHELGGFRLAGPLLRALLPLYFSPKATARALPLVQRLWASVPAFVLKCCRQAYAEHPTAATVAHIIGLMRSVPSGGPALMDMPSGREVVMAVACVLFDRGELELEAWANEQLSGPNAASASDAALALLARHAQRALPRSQQAASATPVTLESMLALLKALDRCSSPVPETAQRIEQGIGVALRAQPSLAPLLAPSATTGATTAGAAGAPAGAPAAALDQAQSAGERLSAAAAPGAAPGGAAGATTPSGTSSDEIEEITNSYFQKIYTSEQSIAEVIEMLKRFKSSSNQREQEIFACMIHNLFDEYRFFHKYPEKELRITGILFGMLVQHQLVTSITLGMALRFVLEALRKPLWQNGKLFRFGMFALEQFKGRIGEWPQYCSHIVQIDYLVAQHKDLVDEIKRAMESAGRTAPAESALGAMEDAAGGAEGTQPASLDAPPRLPAHLPSPGPAAKGSPDGQAPLGGAQGVLPGAPGLDKDAPRAPGIGTAPVSARGMNAGAAAVVPSSAAPPAVDRGLLMEEIMPAGAEPVALVAPPEAMAERVQLVFNNVSMQNLDQKAAETRGLLEAEFLPWFGNYLVVKRISNQANFHGLYMAFLLKLDAPEVMSHVLASVFHNVSKLLASPKITTSTSERSLLKNLGAWLGQMTLGRNKPILQRKLDVKELLCQGYETGRLIAVTPFVAKIMEGGKDSRVFRAPNPWIMSLMGILRELYDLEDLKMNIKFEIEVLCKHLGLKIDEVPPQRVLYHRLHPRKDKTPDFNTARPPAAVLAAQADAGVSARPDSATQHAQNGAGAAEAAVAAVLAPASGLGSGLPGGTSGGTSGAAVEHTVIPNLGAYVTVNVTLELFQQHAALKSVVPVAVDRAIREIIQPVVERSVTIACITTKELVAKDFATEASEQKMRKGAQLMVANLAGSLAVVTCKEPLRLSMANNLRSLLQTAAPGIGVDATCLEQAAQACAMDNLELGCILIEKAATEAAIRDVDEALAAPLAERRKAAAQGVPLVDEATGKRYPALPDMLRPAHGGLGPAQLLVYEAFARQPRQPVPPQPVGVAGSPALQQGAQAPGEAAPATLDTAQAMAVYGRLVTALEGGVAKVLAVSSGRAVSLAMLGPDHEVSVLVRQALEVTAKIALAEREAAAYQFAKSVFFKKVVEAEEPIKLEAYVGILVGLKDECKKLSKDVMAWVGYMTLNDESDAKRFRLVLVLLVRTKLCSVSEVDAHLGLKMNQGAATPWVDLGMAFVRQCVVERLGAWSDFGSVFDALGKAAQRHGMTRKINKFMDELRAAAALSASQLPLSASASAGGAGLSAGGGPVPAASAGEAKWGASDPAREQVTLILERWLRVWNEAGGAEQKCVAFIPLLHQQSVLKSEETTEIFLRMATELCVDACAKSAQQQQAEPSEAQLVYSVVDAWSNLLVLLVKYGATDPSSVTSRVHFLGRILGTVCRALLADAAEAQASGAAGQRRPFDQRPYLRLLLNLLRDLNSTDPVVEANNLQVLGAFASAFHALQPANAPAFAFAWLELVSHRCFMPAVLLAKPAQKGWMLMHRLLMALFSFMEPFLRRAALPPAIRTLYKGTLRVLLVLLHDTPEFLADYHFSFCDVVPNNCIQLRNLFLSAFPRAMRLPDPFTPNLKVDSLPEIALHPRILSNIVASLAPNGLRGDLDTFLKAAAPERKAFLEWLPDRLRLGPADAAAAGTAYNLPAINSLVVYVGNQGLSHVQNKFLAASPVMEVFQALVGKFDAEGRYAVLNAIANQLRFPNSHTHYFSFSLLVLFADSPEAVKEQVTRVLLERLIVHRPHPWGLLITFIELIKNPRYAFWAHKFTKCAPEIEKVFDSVSRSCMGPASPAEGDAIPGGGA